MGTHRHGTLDCVCSHMGAWWGPPAPTFWDHCFRSNCTLRYLILFFHTTLCSPRTIFRYWKDLLSVTIKASVFSAAIFRPPLFNQRFSCHRLSLILSYRIPTSSAGGMASASSAKPMTLVRAGRSMCMKSSYMTFHTSDPTHNLFSRHRLNAVLPSGGIKSIAYVNANQQDLRPCL